MDCKSARTLLDFAQPQGFDLAAEERAALEAHLAECSDCDCLARAERQFDAHVGKAIRDVPMPQGFKERLLTKLRRERDDWWKQWGFRGLRYGFVAAAAVLLVWAGFQWKANQLDERTADELVQKALTPYVYSPPTAEDAEDWFKKKGKPVSVPRDFNYQFLSSFSLAPFDEREVPQLLFVRSYPNRADAQVAQVFILSKHSKYDVRGLSDKVRAPAGYRVQVEVDPRGNEAYVIAFTGDLDKLKQESE
jgi:hypothetical protein